MDPKLDAMESTIEIAKLDELLGPHLGATEQISGYRTKSHTKPGDNFGSFMISLDVDITNEDTGTKRTLHLVNKMIPHDPQIQEIFNTKVTYLKEMAFYLNATPAMLKLQRDHGVPETDWITTILPKCYGARPGFGLEVDQNAAILLENLNSIGYSVKNKKVGLDFEHARLVMEKIAYLHALPIALKRERPSEFETGIKPAMNTEFWQKPEMVAEFNDLTATVFRKLPINPTIIEEAINMTTEMCLGRFPEVRAPFETLSHEDLWVNNVMFVSEPPVRLAFVDFQMSRFMSPMLDVVFFLFTSVTPSVRRKHFDELFDAYYESFCKCLRQVHSDVGEFTKQAFLKEMDRVGGSRLLEVFGRLRVVELRKEDIKPGGDWFLNPELGGDDYLNRLQDVVLDFHDRGWLNRLKSKC